MNAVWNVLWWINVFIECNKGSFGQNCTQTCGNCFGKQCHHVNGTCAYGCNPGYKGVYCTKGKKYGPLNTHIIIESHHSVILNTNAFVKYPINSQFYCSYNYSVWQWYIWTKMWNVVWEVLERGTMPSCKWHMFEWLCSRLSGFELYRR